MKLVFLLSVFFATFQLKAQDLIVTNEGDSLNCKITKEKELNIYFTFKHKGEVRNTLLPRDQIKFFQAEYFNETEVSEQELELVKRKTYSAFRLAVNGGLGYRVAKMQSGMPSELESYVKGLRSGYHFSVSGIGYTSEQFGIGLKYSFYNAKNSASYINGYQKVEDDISIHFVGPIVNTRFYDANSNNCWVMNLGIGYMGYKGKGYADEILNTKGSTLGISYDIGYDVALSKNVALGFQFSFLGGTLQSIKKSNGDVYETIELDEDSYESLSRIDLSIGLRFNL